MIFILSCLALTAVFYVTYIFRQKKQRLFKILFSVFFSLSFLLSIVSLVQSSYLSNKCVKINALVTFDEENYPETHFVNIYQNTETEKFYSVENFHGIFIFNEITLSENAEPIFANTTNAMPYSNGVALYEYS